jgi:hypothetical protein
MHLGRVGRQKDDGTVVSQLYHRDLIYLALFEAVQKQSCGHPA